MLLNKINQDFCKFIENSLIRIYNDFKIEAVPPRLCEIKDFRFDKGHVPNYSIKLNRQLYMLKFLSIYCIEYKYIYEKLINGKHLDLDKIKILSIGSGCGLDFYGLYWALNSTGNNLDTIDMYLGLDIVDWDYKDLISKQQIPKIVIDDVKNLGTLNEELNVFMFSKSISELSKASFDNLKKLLVKTNFKSDKLAIIASMRDKNSHIDSKRLDEVVLILEQKTYVAQNKDTFFGCSEGNYISDFGVSYPVEIKNYLLNLKNNCKELPNCGQECLEVLNYHNKPMYSTEYITFKMIILNK